MKFEYKNSRGELNEWELLNPVVSDEYIQGVAVPNLGFRTFRRDRVVTMLPDDYVITPKQLSEREERRPRYYKDRQIEICFTGFVKAKRVYLESLASNEYNMMVRTRVTANLDYLVAGDNAGPVKLLAADEQGVWVLTEDGFKELLHSGDEGR